MRIIIDAKSRNTYFVQLPNYFDSDKLPEVMKEISYEFPKDDEIVHYYMHGDDITNGEKKQLDIYGEIKYPLIPLKIDILTH